MSEAKKCDNCETLYEPSKDDNKVTVKDATPGYKGNTKVIGFLKLFRSRGFRDEDTESMDHCQGCTARAVRAFMQHFNIPERKGESFQCRIRVTGQGNFFEEGPALSKEDNQAAREKNHEFFTKFSGKRVRITVEVL